MPAETLSTGSARPPTSAPLPQPAPKPRTMVLEPAFWGVILGCALLVWRLPVGFRPWFLSAVSIGFLAWFAWEPVAILLAWVSLFWFGVRGPEPGGRTHRSFHFLLILGVLFQLAWFKYLPPMIAALSTHPIEARVVVPLGMSFFTFKLVHYAFEVSRGTAQKGSFPRFLCYMFLFPIFTAGPIERWDHFIANQEDRPSLQSLSEGALRIAHGFIKRFLVAEACLVPLLERFGNDPMKDPSSMAVWEMWAYLGLSFAFVYMDFSGYSDIGIGASRLLGLRIAENFRFPFLAGDIADFWKRWHISLSRWCQSYVYLPTMGVTRNPFTATFATFLVMGLWHAGTLNRIGWGMYHAIGTSAFIAWTQVKRRMGWKKLFQRPSLHVLGVSITAFFVAGSMAFVAAEAGGSGLSAALLILGRLVGLGA